MTSRTRTIARLILAASGVLAATAARADGPPASRSVDDTLQLELTPAGFSAIADIARASALGDMQDVALPDVQQTLTGGINLSLSGIKASVTFKSLTIEPAEGVLNVRAGIHGLKVDIDSVNIEKTVLGAHLSTTCSALEIDIAEDGIVYPELGLEPLVANDNIGVLEHSLHFQVGSDNYHVNGPAACSGWIIGKITRFVMHEALVLVRPFLQDLIKDKVRGLMPVISEQLNEQVHVSAALNIAGLPSLPTRTVQLDAYPSSLRVTPEGMKVAMGVRIGSIMMEERARLRDAGITGPARYGSLGVNPGVVTTAFEVLWPEGSDYYDVTKQASVLLGFDSMSSIWPDLTKVKATEKTLRLQVRLAQAPVLAADPVLNAVTAHLPKLQMKFQIDLNNVWQDYFIMDVDMATGANVKITNNLLEVGVIKQAKVVTTGAWAPGYKPIDDRFEADTAEALISGILDLVASSGPVFHTKLPELKMGDYVFKLASPHVDGPFIAVDFTGP